MQRVPGAKFCKAAIAVSSAEGAAADWVSAGPLGLTELCGRAAPIPNSMLCSGFEESPHNLTQEQPQAVLADGSLSQNVEAHHLS
ncbi:MAG: hypothetical protein IPK05_18775 [Comamonadaceae bacterium]|nr:hypothetical protein [Comamonadaceae bacterium]